MRLWMIAGLLLCLGASTRASAAAPSDPLVEARRLAAIEEGARCDASTILCEAGRLSLMDSISNLVLQSSDCDDVPVLSYCRGEAGKLVADHLKDRTTVLAAGLDLLPGTSDSRFDSQFASALAQVKQACAYGTIFCTDAKLAVLAQADHIVRQMSCDARASQATCQGRKAALIKQVDQAAAAELSQVFQSIGWPTIDTYGSAADDHAWLLVKDAATDPVLQKRALALAQAADARGVTDRVDLPALTDRVAANDKRPQTFGTLGACKGKGVWKPDPIASPAGLDGRRTEAGLEPMAGYIKRLSTDCR